MEHLRLVFPNEFDFLDYLQLCIEILKLLEMHFNQIVLIIQVSEGDPAHLYLEEKIIDQFWELSDHRLVLPSCIPEVIASPFH